MRPPLAAPRRTVGATRRQRDWNDRPMPTKRTQRNLPGPAWWVGTSSTGFTQTARARAAQREHDSHR